MLKNPFQIEQSCLYGKSGDPIFVVANEDGTQISTLASCREIILTSYWAALNGKWSAMNYGAMFVNKYTDAIEQIENYLIKASLVLYVKFSKPEQLDKGIKYIEEFEATFNLPKTEFEVGEWTKIILSSHWRAAPPLFSTFLLLLRASGLSLNEEFSVPKEIKNHIPFIVDINNWGKAEDHWVFWHYEKGHKCGTDFFSIYCCPHYLPLSLQPIHEAWKKQNTF